ncbi:DUF4365 domain-containing protein [Flavobacterium sp. FlaQc-28]|uniref:DUF4365 domain-containing protein n=1 Tax=Flavobacterium sp. FlaQc-28 TaxID=3374178 RepID=UPI003757A713
MSNKISKPSNKYIEKTANDAITGQLRDLFLSKNLELGENPTNTSQDWGTDFYIEVINRDTKRELLFLIQCKGTNKNIQIKRDRTFSFKMSLRHANYFYYELSEPLMFMVCDIQTKDVYWYSVQIDDKLEAKIIEQVNTNKESLQVSIPSLNILKEENFDRFLLELEESRKAQIHKHKTKINANANYDLIKKNIDKLNIVDAIIKMLDMYQGINVFPSYIISKLYPLKKGEGTFLYGETLSTDNEIFFDFLQNLEVHKNKFYLKSINVDYAVVTNLQKKLRRILDFLQVNLITHVEWKGSTKKDQRRICVHDLYISSDCKCERCTYKKLNLNKTVNILSIENDNLKPEDRLRRAYSFFLIADLEESYLEYTKILREISINKNPGIYIIAKYNLLQLKKMIDNYSFINSRNEILKALENENFVLDEILMPEYYLDIFKLIKENKLIPESILSIDNTLSDIQKIWHSDQLGGSATNNHARSIIIEFLRAYDFIEYNLLIYNESREFEVLINKALEGIFALYSLNNPSSSRYEHFGHTIIDMWLFHAEPNHIKHLLVKYRLKSLKLEFKDTVFNRISEYIINLINSADLIKNKFKESNYTHNEKIARIIQNYLLIIAMIRIDEEKRNFLLNKYLLLIESLNQYYFTSLEYLFTFLDYTNDVNLENLEKIIQLLASNDNYRQDAFSLAVKIYANKFKDPEILENELKKVLAIDHFDATDFYNYNKFSNLIFIIPKLTNSTQNIIKHAVELKLKEDFDNSIFYYFTIYDIIDFNKLFLKKYIDFTPDYTSIETLNELLVGKKERKNFHLNKVINLMFKFNLEFTDEIRSLSSKALDKDYYDWLMNIDEFNYSKFSIYWILHNRTEYYLKAYKKSKILKTQVALGLKENYIEGVARIFINHLS